MSRPAISPSTASTASTTSTASKMGSSMNVRRSFYLSTLLCVAASLASVACNDASGSGDEGALPDVPGVDAGYREGGANGAAADGVGTSRGATHCPKTPPIATGDAFCDALLKQVGVKGLCTDFAAACKSTSARTSAGYKAAYVDCAAINVGCDPLALRKCVDGKLATTSLTAAQSKVASDLCATCPGDTPDPACAARMLAFQGGDAGLGPAAPVREASDVIATQIDTRCTGKALAVYADLTLDR